MRTVLTTNFPAPYRQELYGELAARLDDLVVVYEASESGGRGWGRTLGDAYQYEFAADRPIEEVSQVARARGMRAALRRVKPDVLLFAGFGAAAVAAREWAAEARVPTIGVSGATAWADRDVTGPRRALRSALARSAAGWIAYGPEARRYLVELGVAEHLVGWGGNPYGVSLGPSRTMPAEGVRRVGFAGQLHWRKAWWVPVKAAAIANARGGSFSVELLGNGPGAGLLQQLIAEVPQVDVTHTPKLPPSEMAGLYDRIDVLVAPSLSDQWPIVASEAAARGVPVITTPELVSGLPPVMSTAGPYARAGSVHAVARLLNELRDPAAYGAALERVEVARTEAAPATVAQRWVDHLRTIVPGV